MGEMRATERLAAAIDRVVEADNRYQVQRDVMRARSNYEQAVIVPWLEAHGIKADAAYGFEIRISGQTGEPIMLTVHRYALNEQGSKFYDPATNDPAVDEDITVPLVRWPENP